MRPSERNLAHDPTSQVATHLLDDRFVAVRCGDLVDAVTSDVQVFGHDAAGLRPVAEALRAIGEQEAAAFERELADHYALVNPDCDTVWLCDPNAQRTPERYEKVYAHLAYLLDKANFHRFEEVDLDQVVRSANSHGLTVRLRPERIDSLTIWCRGHGMVERTRRTPRHPIAGEKFSLGVYRRLVVVARLRNDPNVLLKMFKDIPEVDVDALLPHAEVQMNWFDRAQMMAGGVGTLGTTAGKLFSLFTGVALLGQWLWVLLVGALMLTVRTVLGYRRARLQRDWQRTRHLYYQNLNNNAATIHTLIDMTTQEEFKEAFLAYAFCWAAQQSGAPPLSSAELRTRIEAYLRQRLRVAARFDLEDALESLSRLALWNPAAPMTVVPPADATEQLRRHWFARRSEQYHSELSAAGRGAPRATPEPKRRAARAGKRGRA